jgi:SMC interacting uncharacterized protein involved in chromosome segregation
MKGKLGWILFVVALIVIYWLAKCNGNGTKTELPKPPEVKTEPVQQAEVKSDEDSINNIIKPLEGQLNEQGKRIERLSSELIDGQDKILFLQQESDSLRSLLKASELTTSLNESADKIRAQIKKNDSLCNKNIAALNKKLSINSDILSAEKKKYQKLKLNFDSCTSGITEQKKYQDKIKPRNKVSIGITAGYIPETQSFAYGAVVQYSMKNGYSIQGEALQIRGAQMYKAGILKTITLKHR